MTDHPATGQRAAPESRRATPTPERGPLEQAFHRSLAAGPAALTRQVRYILALSQMTAAAPAATPHQQKPVPVTGARLAALVELADTLDDAQRRNLVKEIQQLHDSHTRLCLLLQMTPHLPVAEQKALMAESWRQAGTIDDPVTRSELLHHLAEALPATDEAAIDSPVTRVLQLARSMQNLEARIRALVALATILPGRSGIDLFNRVLDEIDHIDSDILHANAINTLSGHLPETVEERAIKSALKISSPVERARALTTLARSISPAREERIRSLALNTIADIRNEEERAEALIEFAPFLEPVTGLEGYPELLERALSIAVSLSKRYARAQALVALAPHLTPDLQGEALAAVNSLADEGDRALLLADLAPTLPPDILVASMAVAHTMREQDARVHALTILAHYAPAHARSQTMLDALAAATNLPHHYERVTALMALVDVLPPQLQDQAFTSALETTRLIENENSRARALSLLGQHLPPRLLNRALEAAYEIEDLQQRLNALLGMITRVTDRERLEVQQHLLESARQIPFDYKRARALASIAPHLSPELIQRALEIAEQLDDPYDRVSTYIALAQNLPPEKRPPVIARAKETIGKIDDGYDRSSALAAIAPFLPDSQRSNLSQLIYRVIRSIEDDYDQASAISILAPLLIAGDREDRPALPDQAEVLLAGLKAALEIPQQTLRVRQFSAGLAFWEGLDETGRYELWQAAAWQLSSLPLADVLLCLGAALPVLQAIGGEENLEEIAQILGVR
jgi:hypothetical protein